MLGGGTEASSSLLGRKWAVKVVVESVDVTQDQDICGGQGRNSEGNGQVVHRERQDSRH